MTKPTAQQCHALTTYFVNAVVEATGKKPVVNRNKARWGFESVLMDYDQVQSRELIDYYVSNYNQPTVDWFLYNYEKIEQEREDKSKNEAAREHRREITRQRLEEWKKRWEN